MSIAAEVLVVGAGPVGLTLSLDLSKQGVRVLLVEKNLEPLKLPKMERSNPRTMEIWRRLGVDEDIRSAGLPSDKPMDVVVVRNLVQDPLVRQVYPSVDEWRQQIEGTNDGSQPREPYQLVSQYEVEPILMRHAQRAGIEILRGWEFVGQEQDDAGVTSVLRHPSGNTRSVTTKYLVGTDGGSSMVRKSIGVELEGCAGLGTVYNIFFRCDDFIDKCKPGFARHYCFAGEGAGGGAAGTIVIQGDVKHFAMHVITTPPDDPGVLLRDVTGLDIHPEILYSAAWNQHMLVAQRHRVGRVFLAGDSNHLFIPAGGLGMNTGIADAVNLGWKLAAVLRNWGGPALLESYQEERRYAALRNRDAATWAIDGVLDWRGSYDELIDSPTPEGLAARSRFVERAERGNRRVYEMHGADRDYRYASAIIDPSEGPAPQSEYSRYSPTTHPGAHLPHVWLESGVSIYDRLSTQAFTLVVLRAEDSQTEAVQQAFESRRIPLDILRIADRGIRKVYERDYVLVRPDFHVAWRGNALPGDPASLAALIAGWVNGNRGGDIVDEHSLS